MIESYLKMSAGYLAFLVPMVILGCASTGQIEYYAAPNKRYVSPTFDLSARFDSVPPYPDLKKQWTVCFNPRNPLYVSSAQVGDSEETQLENIEVEATLYDPLLIEAWVRYQAQMDSSATDGVGKYRRIYARKHDPENLFRIELELRSGFAEKSIDLEPWTIYLVDNQGTFYEPKKVDQGAIIQSKMELEHHGLPMERTLISSTANLYFPQVTFYGHRILGKETEFLKLIFAYQKEVEGEGIWVFAEEDRRKGWRPKVQGEGWTEN